MKTLLLPLLVLLTFSCYSQDRKSLEERAQKFYTFGSTSQYDSLVNYLHSSLFKNISKKEFIDYLNKTETSNEITLSSVNTPPNFYFGEIKKIDETYYCIFYYDKTSKAKFHDEISKEKSEFLIEYTKKRLKVDRVVFNERQNAIFTLSRTKDIAICNKNNNYVWMFSPEINDRSIREQLGL